MPRMTSAKTKRQRGRKGERKMDERCVNHFIILISNGYILSLRRDSRRNKQKEILFPKNFRRFMNFSSANRIQSFTSQLVSHKCAPRTIIFSLASFHLRHSFILTFFPGLSFIFVFKSLSRVPFSLNLLSNYSSHDDPQSLIFRSFLSFPPSLSVYCYHFLLQLQNVS